MKMLCLGDSYTIGEGVNETQTWPNQLIKQLENEQIKIARCDVIAKTGWTTNDLNQAINKFSSAPHYDLVTLSIGVNNQYQGIDIQTYKIEFTHLLKNAIRFANNNPAHVLVISIPGYEKTSFASDTNNLLQRKEKYSRIQDMTADEIGRSIDQYNHAAQQIISEMNAANSAKISFIDITPITREKAGLTTRDGLHPSAEMYQEWVKLILPYVNKIRF